MVNHDNKPKLYVLNSSWEGVKNSELTFQQYKMAQYDELSKHYDIIEIHILFSKEFETIKALKEQSPKLVINLCDAFLAEDRAGLEVLKALEHYDIAYTGDGLTTFTLTKSELKTFF